MVGGATVVAIVVAGIVVGGMVVAATVVGATVVAGSVVDAAVVAGSVLAGFSRRRRGRATSAIAELELGSSAVANCGSSSGAKAAATITRPIIPAVAQPQTGSAVSRRVHQRARDTSRTAVSGGGGGSALGGSQFAMLVPLLGRPARPNHQLESQTPIRRQTSATIWTEA